MREIGASRSGHICTPSHPPQPFHWVQHRRGLSNTDMSLAAKAHHSILPTCLGGNLGQIVVDITSISLSSWYSARHTVTALYRRLLRTSVPALLPRHATGQRGPYCARSVHTVHSSPTSPNDCRNQEPSLKIPCCRDRRMWRELVISRLSRWRRGPTRIRRIWASLSCTQFRYRHLEDIIHMPLLRTEHTNLPCGVLLFNIDEDCSNTYTRPPQLSLVHHNSPTSGTLLTELRFGKISRPSKPDSTYVQSRLAGAGCVIYKGNLDRAADRLLPIHLCCWLLTTRSSARLPRGSKQAASRRCSARMWESRHSRTRKAPRTCCDASIGRLCLGRLSQDRVLAATLASRIAWR